MCGRIDACMKAVILAAGRGRRMSHATTRIPKCMTLLWNRPLLEYQLCAIEESGIKDVSIVCGYKMNSICVNNVSYFRNSHWKTTNMVASMMCAREKLISDACIISYSDIVYNACALKKLMNSEQPISILYMTKWEKIWRLRFENPLLDVESFKINQDGRIYEIGKRTKNIEEIQGQYIGLIKIMPLGFDLLEKTYNRLSLLERRHIDMTSLLSLMIDKSIDIYGIPYDGICLEVDRQEDVNIYESKGDMDYWFRKK